MCVEHGLPVRQHQRQLPCVVDLYLQAGAQFGRQRRPHDVAGSEPHVEVVERGGDGIEARSHADRVTVLDDRDRNGAAYFNRRCGFSGQRGVCGNESPIEPHAVKDAERDAGFEQ